ncbi:DNA polymerase IV [Globicatella sanguinis]|uniref:DNA polymerase IV n=1 Tax=Globicatella sanguinis TaxID=13076 RepID=UPI000C7E1EBB|nr:DNA polymerase IV [Globicatella sanguinis]MDK7631365.1 DNA polymerase IV [Globicatella sanguinis]WIK66493.1 DNA polymerase IV [Globicatella sanguinis]WKT55898.1 DNA polymerase IV [Globicatella sanguinis]
MKYGLLTFEEPKPDTTRKILHVDMDAFYASIEVRDNPSLKNRPVVIAKHPNLTGGRGIVATCNYIARQYGIHSAMSAVEAYKLCPKAIFIQGNMDYYREVSQQIRAIFLKYTDVIEPLSLDEAYLDVTVNKINEASALKIAHLIQKEIYETLSLTCSIGVSYNKFIAKIASDYHKPHGITIVTPQEATKFLQALPIDKFYGVGVKSIPHFHELGIFNGKDLYQQDLDTLIKHFGKMGYSLYFKVRGIHNTAVNQQRDRKSIGRERTFTQFLNDEEKIIVQFEKLTHSVMKKVRGLGLLTNSVTIKIRYGNFETITRQMQAEDYFDSYEEAISIVKELWLKHGNLDQEVRLLGVSVSNLLNPETSVIQLTIHEGSVDEWLGSSN